MLKEVPLHGVVSVGGFETTRTYYNIIRGNAPLQKVLLLRVAVIHAVVPILSILRVPGRNTVRFVSRDVSLHATNSVGTKTVSVSPRSGATRHSTQKGKQQFAGSKQKSTNERATNNGIMDRVIRRADVPSNCLPTRGR